jgi:MFS superfamily sulfate permease-like transporter
MALVAWLLRLGFFADLLSRPVLVGCLAGKIGTELLFPTLPTAVQAYRDRMQDPASGNQGP